MVLLVKKQNLLLSLITVVVVIWFISLVIVSCSVAVVVFLRLEKDKIYPVRWSSSKHSDIDKMLIWQAVHTSHLRKCRAMRLRKHTVWLIKAAVLCCLFSLWLDTFPTLVNNNTSVFKSHILLKATFSLATRCIKDFSAHTGQKASFAAAGSPNAAPLEQQLQPCPCLCVNRLTVGCKDLLWLCFISTSKDEPRTSVYTPAICAPPTPALYPGPRQEEHQREPVPHPS